MLPAVIVYSALDSTDYKGILAADEEIAAKYAKIHDLMHHAMLPRGIAPKSAAMLRIEKRVTESN